MACDAVLLPTAPLPLPLPLLQRLTCPLAPSAPRYEPAKRSLNWLKLKKDYLDGDGFGDSVDLVPIAAYKGRGKRTGVYGAYLLACYCPEADDYQCVCKIGTGFSDEILKTLTAKMDEGRTLPKQAHNYVVGQGLEPDVWLDGSCVWEVKAADLSLSNAHRGALGKTPENGRGVGLRFPRFLHERDDKGPTDATTDAQILDMYLSQDVIANTGGGKAKADDFDDDEDCI